MIGELLFRFLLGGAIVTAFAAIGELFRPKTFAGIFSAAPSVALATLSLAFAKHGPDNVALLARSMTVGAIALYVYGAACVVATKDGRVPVWASAMAAWGAWFAVAFGVWFAASGALQ